jgi:hypothetical protein
MLGLSRAEIALSFYKVDGKFHVSEVSTIFAFFLSRFAQRLVLTLKMVVLDAELNSLSNGARFDRGHRLKSGSYGEKLVFWPSVYSEILSFLSRFVQGLIFTLKMIVLDAELNSLSNGVRFNRGQRQKKKSFPPNTRFYTSKPCPDSLNDLCKLWKWLC